MTYVISYQFMNTASGLQWVALGGYVPTASLSRFTTEYNPVDAREMDRLAGFQVRF